MTVNSGNALTRKLLDTRPYRLKNHLKIKLFMPQDQNVVSFSSKPF